MLCIRVFSYTLYLPRWWPIDDSHINSTHCSHLHVVMHTGYYVLWVMLVIWWSVGNDTINHTCVYVFVWYSAMALFVIQCRIVTIVYHGLMYNVNCTYGLDLTQSLITCFNTAPILESSHLLGYWDNCYLHTSLHTNMHNLLIW